MTRYSYVISLKKKIHILGINAKTRKEARKKILRDFKRDLKEKDLDFFLEDEE